MGVEFEHQGINGPILDLWCLIGYHLVGQFPGFQVARLPLSHRRLGGRRRLVVTGHLWVVDFEWYWAIGLGSMTTAISWLDQPSGPVGSSSSD